MSSAKGVGASLPRKEDHRLLRGRGEFVADIAMAGAMDVAFVRSPLAHALIRNVTKPPGDEARVFTAADLAAVRPIVARSGLPGFKVSEQPVLAAGRVRYAGEPIAACLGDTRAAAEDVASRVALDLEELPAVADMLRARAPDAPLLHPEWGDNVFLESKVDRDLSEIERKAAVSVTRTFRTARQCMSPIEGRGVIACWDRRQEMLVLHTACQMPHIVRTGLAECLGLEQDQVRIVVPDVGGGFGYKGVLLAEEIVLGWIAMHREHPVRWIEDRREQLTANASCREHHYVITGHAAADGTLLAIDCEAHVDAGAWSAYPFSACLEAAQVASILPGPYVFEGYRCRTWSMATSKPPILPYRGVARTGVCFALEVLLDAMARELGMDPVELRLKNLVRPEQMPFDNITGKHFDSGDYPECLRRAAAAIDLPAVRERQRRGESDGRRIGAGFAIFCEQAAHGTSVYAAWGVPMIPGHEQAGARMTPSGGLELRVGVHSHGQGLETTLAQVAHEVLGIDPGAVKVVHGDTALTPYSTGTWGSRAMVMAGGAVAAACEALAERVGALGAHLLQAARDEVTVRDGGVYGPSGHVSLEEVARLWYLQPENLPDDADPRGLEATEGYQDRGRLGHVLLRRACLRGRGRPRNRRGGAARLCGRRRRRCARQPHDRRRPGPRGHRAGHRHRAVRGDALRRRRAAARLDPCGLPPPRRPRDPRDTHRAHGDAVALYPVRPEGHRRGRRDRAAGRDRERGQRRAGGARGGGGLHPDHDAEGAREDHGGGREGSAVNAVVERQEEAAS